MSRAPVDFGDPTAELRAALDTCALVDRSSRSRLLGTGRDLLDLLQRLGTGDVARLAPGAGAQTVLTTNKGRIVERLFLTHLGERGVLLCGGVDSAPRVFEHVRRYTFAEETGLGDVTDSTVQFAVIGPAAEAVLTAVEFGDSSIHVLGHDGLSTTGRSVLADVARAEEVWQALRRAVEAAGGRLAGTLAAGAARILRGVPDSDSELNEEHNPLEAGLLDAISFDKGCYVGQEVVARLRTYDKVARSLVGLLFEDEAPAPPAGARVLDQAEEIGRVTSATVPPGWSKAAALAYTKRRSTDVGTAVDVLAGDSRVRARLVELPFPAM